MTEAEEQAAIQFEASKFQHRINKLNARLKIIQVTGFKPQINHPVPVGMEKKQPRKPFNWRFWRKRVA